MPIIPFCIDLFPLCLMKADTASEAITMPTLNMSHSIPLLFVMVSSYFQ